MATEFELNGRAVTVDIESDTPLLWALRDDLDLTGTKYGCGIGMCGACTVLVNGRAIRSCITPVETVSGASITTIEGLHPDGNHPLQKAWVESQTPQCGYCQSGQIMQAAAMLKDFPDPSDEQINHAMGGNLCRCMAYVRIRKAIKLAAEEMKGASGNKAQETGAAANE
ncbi:(2Fe-2S)-binding protein [Marinobacter sp.]|uniref:(2Fe-2S)-binding protein n=1 Tax=Marinobacter sp. TaxID=50741 RepID=UPI002B274A3D|nr:(2Fe-2S)-binding protein [Marinobacter sp.]